MRIDILTLFPQLIDVYAGESILKRAQEAGLADIVSHNIRDYAPGKHRITDEPPFGGGGGMVLKAEPVSRALEAVLHIDPPVSAESPLHNPPCPIILLTPQGRPFTQAVAAELARHSRFVLVCGRYEGFDERIRAHLATDEISIGDYVLTGGELAALVVADAVVRLIPGALGAADAAATDSHATGLLEGPHYTKPAVWRGWDVPEVLRSGHAAHIARWRRRAALRRTWERRPEMLLDAPLDEADRAFLAVLADDTPA